MDLTPEDEFGEIVQPIQVPKYQASKVESQQMTMTGNKLALYEIEIDSESLSEENVKAENESEDSRY